jgi:hypothetical protein
MEKAQYLTPTSLKPQSGETSKKKKKKKKKKAQNTL